MELELDNLILNVNIFFVSEGCTRVIIYTNDKYRAYANQVIINNGDDNEKNL